jgi:hypothetical protein
MAQDYTSTRAEFEVAHGHANGHRIGVVKGDVILVGVVFNAARLKEDTEGRTRKGT